VQCRGGKQTSHLTNHPLGSLSGTFVIVASCVLVSRAPKKILWRQVTWGFILQFLLALMMLRWQTGKVLLAWSPIRTSPYVTHVAH